MLKNRFQVWKYQAGEFLYCIFHFRKFSGLSFHEALNLTGCPIITVLIKDLEGNYRKLNLLIDTGADMSRIDSSAIKGMTFSKVGTLGKTVGMGMVDTSTLDIVTIPFLYRNKLRIEDDFVVQDLSVTFGESKKEDGVSIHGVLGGSCFSKYGWIIDYKNHKIY